jgi:hypothetical protein
MSLFMQAQDSDAPHDIQLRISLNASASVFESGWFWKRHRFRRSLDWRSFTSQHRRIGGAGIEGKSYREKRRARAGRGWAAAFVYADSGTFNGREVDLYLPKPLKASGECPVIFRIILDSEDPEPPANPLWDLVPMAGLEPARPFRVNGF